MILGVYRYVAFDEQGRQHKGVLEADAPRGVRQQLRDKGLTPVEVDYLEKQKLTKINGANGRAKPKISIRKINVQDLAMFTRDLSSLVSSGIPVEECLQAVFNQTDKPKIKEMILAVRSRVLEGFSLASGFADFPQVFSEVFCATVAAGEQSGHLDVMLEHLAEYIEHQQEMRQKINQALIYPIFMTVVSIAIVTFLLIFVVPKIVSVFDETGQGLPIMTVILIAISEFAKQFGLYLVGLIILSIIAFKQALKNPKFKAGFHSFVLRLPLLGKMFKLINTSRFCRTLGVLTSAGVPALEAMRISSEVITIAPIREAVRDATTKINEGTPIHHALKQTTYFQPMAIHLIANGVATGQLDTMLLRTAKTQDRTVTSVIESGLAVFEPVLIIIMGGIVLFIVLAILLPMFDMAQLIA